MPFFFALPHFFALTGRETTDKQNPNSKEDPMKVTNHITRTRSDRAWRFAGGVAAQMSALHGARSLTVADVRCDVLQIKTGEGFSREADAGRQ
jgi:hypothetical protein